MNSKVDIISGYTISQYRKHKDHLVIVFASAGRDGLGSPVEEFKNSLIAFDVSLIFVTEESPTWLNGVNSRLMLKFVAECAAKYRKVAVLGESMGASTAITFHDYSDNIDRCLALCPQYSVSRPFINFDNRFCKSHDDYDKSVYWAFTTQRRYPNIHIIYGTSDWRDTPHAGMYLADGYNVKFAQSAGHLVGFYLKSHSTGNRLKDLLRVFLDFSVPFVTDAVDDAIGDLLAKTAKDDTFNFGPSKNREITQDPDALRTLAAPPDLLALHMSASADQSSICEYSAASTSEGDAQRAIDGMHHLPFAFHTALENGPWWAAQLSRRSRVKIIRIYNRIDDYGNATRALKLAIDVKVDGRWEEVYRKDDMSFFGGYDGFPLECTFSTGLIADAVRIRLLGYRYLHLAKVEIFGDII